MKKIFLILCLGVVLPIPMLSKASIFSKTECSKNCDDYKPALTISIKAHELSPSIYEYSFKKDKSIVFDLLPFYNSKSQNTDKNNLNESRKSFLTLFKISF